MHRVPLVKPDLPDFEHVSERFREILDNGLVTNFGKYVQQFERAVGDHLGCHAVTVSSGTIGLLFALSAHGLKPGDKVIVPSFTFMSTAQAVLFAGGIPVFAEVDGDLNMSVDDLEQLLRQHDDVVAVMPVHVYGLPCRVDEIEEVVAAANQRRSKPIAVFYDAAHAFGSESRNRRVGTFGTAEIFSLSVTKILISVEGGLITSKDEQVVDRIRNLRNYGIESNYNALWPGLNGKMSEFHAIVGLESLKRAEQLLSERRGKAEYYLQRIRDSTEFELIPFRDDVSHTFKDFTILLPENQIDKRAEVMRFLKERGLETRAYFCPPAHEQDCFRRFADRPLPRTEAAARRVLTIPFFTSITRNEMDYVVDNLVTAQKRLF